MKRRYLLSFLQWMTLGVSTLLLLGTVSCEKTPEPGPGEGEDDEDPEKPEEVVQKELRNQFALNGDTLDIRTALWEKGTEDNYLIYLTPRSEVEYYEELIETEDFVRIEVRKTNGDIDSEEDLVSLSYRDFRIDASSSRQLDSIAISVLLEDNALKVDFLARKGKTEFACKYDGSVSEFTPESLNNEWEHQREKTSIGSAVEYITEGIRILYLYHGENIIDTPDVNGLSDYITIITPEGWFGELDLEEINEAIDLSYHDLSLQKAQKASGVLNIMKSKNGEKLSIGLDAEIDGESLRISWSGKRWVLMDIEPSLNLKFPDNTQESIQPATVFMEADRLQTTRIAVGLHENPTTWEDLKDRRYAIQFNVLKVGEVIDLSDQNGYGLQVFDYEKYRTYDAAELGAQGSIQIFDDPNGRENVIGFKLNAKLGNGIEVSSEWYGECTLVDRFDLIPVAPNSSLITITDKDGKITQQLPVLELEVLDKPSFQSQLTGAIFQAKEFHFVNENSATGGMNSGTTPILALNVNCVGKENVDLTTEPELFDFRYTPFTSNGIASPTDWSGTTTYGRVSAVEAEGIWKIRLELKDYGDWWGLGNPTGSESTILIEWEGPATE